MRKRRAKFPDLLLNIFFSVFLKKFNWRQQQKISLHRSVNLNSERESRVLESLDRNLSRKNNFTRPKEELNNLRLKYPNRLICPHLNINSVWNKFDLLSDIIKNNIDILMISETKLDSSFPNGQFQIHGYSEPWQKWKWRWNTCIYHRGYSNKTNWFSNENRSFLHWIKSKTKKVASCAVLIILNILKYHII